MGSLSVSLPACASCRVATAVNILFMEPMRKRVFRVSGVLRSRSERPYAWVKTSYHFAKGHFLVGMLCSRWETFLQKILVGVRDTTVETLQPRGALLGGGRIRKLHLRGANSDRKA